MLNLSLLCTKIHLRAQFSRVIPAKPFSKRRSGDDRNRREERSWRVRKKTREGKDLAGRGGVKKGWKGKRNREGSVRNEGKGMGPHFLSKFTPMVCSIGLYHFLCC